MRDWIFYFFFSYFPKTLSENLCDSIDGSRHKLFNLFTYRPLQKYNIISRQTRTVDEPQYLRTMPICLKRVSKPSSCTSEEMSICYNACLIHFIVVSITTAIVKRSISAVDELNAYLRNQQGNVSPHWTCTDDNSSKYKFIIIIKFVNIFLLSKREKKIGKRFLHNNYFVI